ncbi:histidine kinase [Limibacter armeniacum]|uniref:sensor histidine kinase n=1 Tax=Limibacter armeniacum TaxID=466084 RepID=UPI002FE5C9D2
MILALNKNTKKLLATIAILSLAIPAIIIFFLVITTNKDSVVIAFDPFSIDGMLLISYYATLIILVPIFSITWLIKQIRSLLNLKNEKMRMELVHLQSQVNPHFFFNVLNNLYGSIEKDNMKAKTMILKLSEMMRYSIYEGQRELATIGEEIAYLQSYIQLNEARYHKKIEVTFETSIENENLPVTPLLFIILVENAFKHGVEQLRHDAFIHMICKSDGNQVYFEVENNVDPEMPASQEGVGLQNLQRRLELVYPNRHQFIISQTDSTYKVQLTLQAI